LKVGYSNNVLGGLSHIQTSKAGVAIGKLRNSTSPGVSNLAKEVVKKWKEAIEQQKSKRKRDDGEEVKKEDGAKKVKTEGEFPKTG
jgi:transcription elongation factor S-II